MICYGGPMEETGVAKRVDYRKLALAHYGRLGPVACVYCGFGVAEVLEVAHLDCDRSNNAMSNLALLCPTCHRMHDLDLIPTEVIVMMRERPKVVRWSKLMKDAGAKAAETRRENLLVKKNRSLSAVRAVETRRKNQKVLAL